MNNFNINDEDFINTKLYQDFLRDNPSRGFLRVRAFAASQAVPISGLRVVVSTNIGGNNVIFFEGYTNSSGIIDQITLPAPTLDSNNLDAPNKTTYNVVATYLPDNISSVYKVNMYENIYVVQNINIVPDMSMGGF